MTIPPFIRSFFGRGRRAGCEAVGIGRYSRPALHDLDSKLERYLDMDGGFFVEAGANDGFQQSNTYYFERLRRWRGVLIEPIPELAEKCRRLRWRSRVVCAALVEPDYPEAEIEMEFAGLMSVSKGAFGDEARARAHLQAARSSGIDEGRAYSVRTRARMLSEIPDEAAIGCEIDLLSLDVEGAELSALAGLDRRRHSPIYICVEARDPEAVRRLLFDTHDLVEVLTDAGSYQDLLFRRR